MALAQYNRRLMGWWITAGGLALLLSTCDRPAYAMHQPGHQVEQCFVTGFVLRTSDGPRAFLSMARECPSIKFHWQTEGSVLVIEMVTYVVLIPVPYTVPERAPIFYRLGDAWANVGGQDEPNRGWVEVRVASRGEG